MKLLDTVELMQEYAKVAKKYCMYISWQDEDVDELIKAMPYMKTLDILHHASSSTILTFSTEEEMNRHFDMTVGDEGPTELNKYNGPARVYALTCSNEGELWHENT